MFDFSSFPRAIHTIIFSVLGCVIIFSIIKEVKNKFTSDKTLNEIVYTNAKIKKVDYLEQFTDSDRLKVNYEFVTKDGYSVTKSEIITVKRNETKKYMVGNEIMIGYKKGKVKNSKISL
ncbi:hypothetical protein [Pantoea anthophila]|uniref:hypothetical protein n=1 Tax=Pantoea anthophila TaxID=470931 RepID=UPI002DB9A63F|nr:hypothetical protein [Pantoea anthophila]MEB6222018.1 hypothetical protein [Pantoea anthophila]